MWCCFQNEGTHNIVSFLAVGWKSSFAHVVLYLLTIWVPVCLLLVEAVTMGYRVDSEFNLKTNEDW